MRRGVVLNKRAERECGDASLDSRLRGNDKGGGNDKGQSVKDEMDSRLRGNDKGQSVKDEMDSRLRGNDKMNVEVGF
jgi:hypothetical protein